MAVPERRRARIGEREIKLSLGTTDPAEAKIRQAQEQARWRARFRDFGRDIELEATSQAPELVDRFLNDRARRNGAQTNVIFALQSVITMRLFIAWGREEFTTRRADRAFASLVAASVPCSTFPTRKSGSSASQSRSNGASFASSAAMKGGSTGSMSANGDARATTSCVPPYPQLSSAISRLPSDCARNFRQSPRRLSACPMRSFPPA